MRAGRGEGAGVTGDNGSGTRTALPAVAHDGRSSALAALSESDVKVRALEVFGEVDLDGV